MSSPRKSQREQLDRSAKKALSKHPRLTRYTVCFPVDREDPRIDDQNWFMGTWDKHVQKWQQWAMKKEMDVEFAYWGEHEILERLTREVHSGRCFFWFNKKLFSRSWFKRQVERAVADSRLWYIPEIDITLPLSQVFDGIGLTEEFFHKLL